MTAESIKSTLNEVISTLTELTCVRFIPHIKQLDYIEVLADGDNFCASSVGKLGGFQKVTNCILRFFKKRFTFSCFLETDVKVAL